MNYFIITKKTRTSTGLWDLNLDAFVNGKKVGNLVINSGVASRQHFRTFQDQQSGQLEPIPEGEYDLGNLVWAGGKGDYKTLYREVKSPIWVVVVRSRAIGIHLDGNRDYAPGSAGCPVLKNMEDLKTFVSWYENYGHFSKCYVDWWLNYVTLPTIEEPPKEIKRSEPHFSEITFIINDEELPGVRIGNVSYLCSQYMKKLGLNVTYNKDSDSVTIEF
jgi:hypothetical protein